MDCEIVRQSLLEYSHRRLSTSEALNIEKHLAGCRSCRLFLEEERAFDERLSSLPAPSPKNDVWVLVRARTQRRHWGVLRLLAPLARSRRFVTATAMVVVVTLLLVVGVPQQQMRHDHQQIVSDMVLRQTESQVAQKWTDDPLGTTTDQILTVIGEEL